MNYIIFGEVYQFGILATALFPPVHNCSLANIPDKMFSNIAYFFIFYLGIHIWFLIM